jgi:hypothetical protein
MVALLAAAALMPAPEWTLRLMALPAGLACLLLYFLFNHVVALPKRAATQR